MYKPIKTVFVICALLCVFHIGRAQTYSTGLLSSMRGFGVSAEIISKDSETMEIISLYTDTYGVLSNRTDKFGIALSYAHSFIFSTIENEFFRTNFHAGAGGMVGYVHDYEEGYFSRSNRELTKSIGLALALTCEIGARIDFQRHISMDFSFSANPGLHIRYGKYGESLLASLYKNGITRSIFPQVAIMYRF